MRLKLILLTALAALTATGAAVAGNDNGNGQARGHGRAALYVFVGKLTATPSNGGVSITVEGGNRLALRSMLGQPITQTFAYGDRTEFLKWSKGVPTVAAASSYDGRQKSFRPLASVGTMQTNANSRVLIGSAPLLAMKSSFTARRVHPWNMKRGRKPDRGKKLFTFSMSP